METSRRALTLPLICTTQVTASSTTYAGSATGKSWWTTESVWPSLRHSSSAMCGASGATSSTRDSATVRATGPPTLVRWLFSSVTLAMAVFVRQALQVLAHAVDRLVQRPQGVLVGRGVDDRDLARGLVDDVAPQPLQQPVLAHHRARVPRPRHVQWTHRHLVQAQGVPRRTRRRSRPE